MKKALWVLSLAVFFVFAINAQTVQNEPEGPLGWAFQEIAKNLPPVEQGPKQVPGSTKTYTQGQIGDLLNPPDWFPEEHPPAPSAVVKGQGAVLACGSCHLMSGHGHPESADLTGLPAKYIIQQMADYKSGVRKDAAERMNGIARGLSEEDTRQAAEWFTRLKTGPWTKVLEATMVPKTFVAAGHMRFRVKEGGMEPLGNRIITLPEDANRAQRRDPHSGFIAYVPVGSIARGKALVEGGGGKTIACNICHGDNFQGLADLPRISGLHPIYIFRQLYIFKNGNRHGVGAQLMKKAVAKLSNDDMLAISAYLGSLP